MLVTLGHVALQCSDNPMVAAMAKYRNASLLNIGVISSVPVAQDVRFQATSAGLCWISFFYQRLPRKQFLSHCAPSVSLFVSLPDAMKNCHEKERKIIAGD